MPGFRPGVHARPVAQRDRSDRVADDERGRGDARLRAGAPGRSRTSSPTRSSGATRSRALALPEAGLPYRRLAARRDGTVPRRRRDRPDRGLPCQRLPRAEERGSAPLRRPRPPASSEREWRLRSTSPSISAPAAAASSSAAPRAGRAPARRDPTLPLSAARSRRPPSLGLRPHRPARSRAGLREAAVARARAAATGAQRRRRQLGRRLRARLDRRRQPDRGSDLLSRRADRRGDGCARFACVPAREIFARTGIQFLPINTMFQLVAHASEGFPPRARAPAADPDLVNVAAHRPRASPSTQRDDDAAGQRRDAARWDDELIAALGAAAAAVLPDRPDAGPTIGPLLGRDARPTGSTALSSSRRRRTTPAVPSPARRSLDGWAYISSGTWSLVGVERARHADQPRSRAPQLHERRRRVRHDAAPEERRWACGSSSRAAASGRRRASTSTTGTCSSKVAARQRTRRLHLSRRPAVPQSAEHAGRASPSRCAKPARSAVSEPSARGEGGPGLAGAALRIDRRDDRVGDRPRRSRRADRRRRQPQRLPQSGDGDASPALPVLAGPVEATVIGNIARAGDRRGRVCVARRARRAVAEHIVPERFDPKPTARWSAARAKYHEIRRSHRAKPEAPPSYSAHVTHVGRTFRSA